MEVNVVKSGKKEGGGFWHLCSATDADGYIKSGLFSAMKEHKIGKNTIPANVYQGMKWTY